MSKPQIFHALYWITFLFVSTVAFFVFRRRLHKEVPWFATYLLLIAVDEAVSDYVLMFVGPVEWWYVSWFFGGCLVVLGSMFTIEGIRNQLVDYPTIRSWARNILIIAVLLFAVLAVLLVPYGSEHTAEQMKFVQVSMRTARFIQLSVLVVFFAFAAYLSLSWKHYQIGILLGYGLYVAVDLSCTAFIAQAGREVAWRITLIQSWTFILVLLLWLRYIIKVEPRSSLPLPGSSSEDLDRWNHALEQIVKR